MQPPLYTGATPRGYIVQVYRLLHQFFGRSAKTFSATPRIFFRSKQLISTTVWPVWSGVNLFRVVHFASGTGTFLLIAPVASCQGHVGVSFVPRSELKRISLSEYRTNTGSVANEKRNKTLPRQASSVPPTVRVGPPLRHHLPEIRPPMYTYFGQVPVNWQASGSEVAEN